MSRYFPKRVSIAARTNQNEVAWGVTPQYNGSWLQVAQTNNEIIRQSKKSAWEAETGISNLGNANNIRHVYSECPAINRTGEYMINNMTSNAGVLSKVGGNVQRKCSDAVRFPRWMNNSDYEVIGVDRATNKKLIKLNVLTDVVTVLADFSNYDQLTVGNSQGAGDILDDRIALTIKDGSDLIVVIWSLSQGAELSRRVFAGEWSQLDNVTISRLGNYWIKGLSASGANYKVYRSSDMQYLHEANDAGHGVMALDSDGVTEHWVSISFSGLYRTVRKINLATGVDTIILGDGTTQFSNNNAAAGESLAGHLGYAPKRPGYVIWSNTDPEGPHTIAWVPLDASQQIEWLCDHRSNESSGYYAEPQATSNFDGSVVAFASNERVQNGEINVFCVRTKASKCPAITTTTFSVTQNASNGTVIGQLSASYNSSTVTTGWRLHNQLNTAFAVSDSGQITVADSSKITSSGPQTIDVIVEGADGQSAEYIVISVGGTTQAPVLDDPPDIVMTAGQTSSFQLHATDAQGDTLNYRVTTTSPSWVTSTSNGFVTCSPATSLSGVFTAAFIASDGSNDSAPKSIDITVTAADSGTGTTYQVVTYDPSAADIVTGSGQTWQLVTDTPGYTGAGLYKATAGFNQPADTTPGVIGYFDVDLTSLPAGSWKMYIRAYATSSSDDSFQAQVGSETINSGQPIFDSSGYSWQTLRDTNDVFADRLISASDTRVRFYPREQNARIDRIVLVESAEAASPSGKKGFEHISSSGNTAPVLADPNDVTIGAGQSGSFQLSATDADGNPISYAVSGTKPNWISCSPSGVVAYSPPDDETGAFAVSFIANDGQSTSNTISVTFTVQEPDPYAISVDISGGQQEFETGKTITHLGQRTIGGTGILQPQDYGHYIDTGQSYGSGVAARHAATKNEINNLNSSHPQIKGYLHRIDWDHYEPTSSQFNGPEVANLDELMTICDAANKSFMIYLKDVAFNTSDLNRTPIPDDLINQGYSVQSGPASNPSVTGKMWNATYMDRFIAVSIDIYNRYKHHPSFIGIMIPETSRSEWVNGASSAIGHDDALLTQYKRYVTNVKSVMQDRWINIQINFMGGHPASSVRLNNLLDHMENVGGCMIGTPDSLLDQYSKNPSHGNKVVLAYDLFRERHSALPMGLSIETRDQPNLPDPTWDLFYNYGANSLKPQFCFWYTWHPHVTNWRSVVLNFLNSKSWYTDTTVATSSNYGGAGGSTVGINPQKVTASYSGTKLRLTPKFEATTSDTDAFTVVFANNQNEDVEYSVTFFDSDPTGEGDRTGTQTSYKSFRHVADINNVISQGAPNWLASRAYNGYSSNYHLISANGVNGEGRTDCDYYPLDLATILPATGSYHMYVRVAAANTSSDSVWAQVGNEQMIQDQPIFTHNNLFNYQTFRDTADVTQERLVSASDGVIKWYPRENNAGLDSFVFVEAAETALPTGSLGFVSFVWPGTTTITPPEDSLLAIGQGAVATFLINFDENISGRAYGYTIIDSDGVASSVVTGTNTDLTTRNGADYYSINYTGAAEGACRIKMSLSSTAGEYRYSEFDVEVIDPATADWPEGASASLPPEIDIVVGGQFTIDADPQNVAQYDLEGDRWSTSCTALEINSATNEVGVFTAKALGTCTITYTMRRVSDASNPLTYSTTVNIVSPQTINPDDYLIKNTQAAVPLDVLHNDVQTRITTFTQPASGFVYANADKTQLYYNAVGGYVGTVTFNYAADDGSGGDIAGTSVTLHIVDPASFEGSVKTTIGVDRYAVRGSSVPFELIVLDNPEGYAMTYNWSHELGAAASFQDGVIDQQRAVLNINRDNIVLSDVLAQVHCEVSEA